MLDAHREKSVYFHAEILSNSPLKILIPKEITVAITPGKVINILQPSDGYCLATKLIADEIEGISFAWLHSSETETMGVSS